MTKRFLFSLVLCFLGFGVSWGEEDTVLSRPRESSYAPTSVSEPFSMTMEKDIAKKPQVMQEHMDYLNARYDLSKRVTNEVTMSRGKSLPVGPTARLPKDMNFETLAKMSPDEIKKLGIFPYKPLAFIEHSVGGMVFPKHVLKELPRLERFDLDFDLPEHFLPEFPPPMYLTTHKEAGDVSQGKLVTIDNYFELFNGLLNPKQLDGLRLLVTQFPQQQFNATDDRKSVNPSLGVTCFDCHANGHTNRATHLVGDIRPQSHRNRINTPTLRGVNYQRLFGSQRALKSIEDFTEFEQRAAYFDGDPATAFKKGVNILERGSEVHHMAEFQALLDFPPAPKLNIYGKLDPKKATKDELAGQNLFFGKANCMECHSGPAYSDNTMHDLQVERFYKSEMVHKQYIRPEGAIKTFPLRGVKDSPPYLHDGRCLTLEDTVEFFNLIQELKLSPKEKKQLVAFLRQL
ncbi:MAG: cytochrome B6 [Candidatus Riflebacteria bacterium]|nr:cytochrome B6 [Candidatus Riflebacteria bacterium]